MERQAAASGRVRPLRLQAGKLHPAALVLRGLHQLLRRPAAAARGTDRRCHLPQAAHQDLQPGAADTRPRGPVGRAGQLRRLGQVLPAGREHGQRHGELLHQGRAGRDVLRPHAAPGRPRQSRRGHAGALAALQGRAHGGGRLCRGAQGARRTRLHARAGLLGARRARTAAEGTAGTARHLGHGRTRAIAAAPGRARQRVAGHRAEERAARRGCGAGLLRLDLAIPAGVTTWRLVLRDAARGQSWFGPQG